MYFARVNPRLHQGCSSGCGFLLREGGLDQPLSPGRAPDHVTPWVHVVWVPPVHEFDDEVAVPSGPETVLCVE